MSERYETRGVLAGAYLNSDDRRVFLTHTVRIDDASAEWFMRDGIPLCERVKADNISDSYAWTAPELQAPPTCPVCLKRDPRFKPNAGATTNTRRNMTTPDDSARAAAPTREDPVIDAYIQIQLRGERRAVERALFDISTFARRKCAAVHAGETQEEGL